MNKLKIFILLSSIFTTALAQSEKELSLSWGLVNGKAGEYVYVPKTGEKASFLDWEIKNIPVFIMDYKHSFNNLEFGINLKKSFSSSSSGWMVDYDWYTSQNDHDENDKDVLVSSSDYGKLSNFSDNKNYVENLIMVDANFRYWFNHSNNFKSGPILGAKYDYFKFSSVGGSQFNYSLDDLVTELPNNFSQEGILYSQKFFTPYIGYGATYNYNKLSLLLEVKGSQFGKAKAYDRHLLRGAMEDTARHKKIKNLTLKLGVSYEITPSLIATGTYEMSQYFKNRKSSSDFTYDDGTKEKGIKNISGIKNTNSIFSLGLTYKF